MKKISYTYYSNTIINAGGGYSSILGGSGNTNSGYYTTIGGGLCNVIGAAANASAILGGACNVVTNNWAGASGCNVVSVIDCAFHANQFVAQNMQIGSCPFGILTPPLIPPGTLWYYPDPSFAGVCHVYIA